MLQYTIVVEGMACSMCEAHVNDAIRKAFPVKKVTSSHSKGQTQILCENRLDEDDLRSAISSQPLMRRRACSPSESKRHAGRTFILGRLDRYPVARGAGGYLPAGRGTPLGRVPVYSGV